MKRFLCLILALLMVFSLLAGCAGKDDKDDEEEKDSTTDVQKDEEDNKNDESKAELPANSTQAKLVGTWNVDLAELDLFPESVEVETFTIGFTSDGKINEYVKISYNGETDENNITGEYYFEGDSLMLKMEGETGFIPYEVEFQGNIVVLTSSIETITLYK